MSALKLVEAQPSLLVAASIAPFCNESESVDATSSSP